MSVNGNPGFSAKPAEYQNFTWPANFFRNCYISLGACAPENYKAASVSIPASIRIQASDAAGESWSDPARILV